MPDLPSYRRKITPRPVGKAPLPVGAADVGAGAIGRGLQRLGRGVSDIARSIFQIEQDKQVIRDNAALASANGDYDKAVADKINEAKRTTFTSIEQFTEFRKMAESDLNAIVESSIGKMGTRAGQRFRDFANSNKQNSLRQIEGIVWQKEIEFGQADTLRQYSNKFEVLAGAGVPVENILKDPSLKIIETGMSPYWRTGELARARDRLLIDALVNVGRYDDARELAQTTKTFTPTEKQARLANINTAERARNTKAQLAQEAYINETHKLTLDALSQDINDLSVLNKLPADLKSYWDRKLIDRDKMIKADRGDPFINVYDPAKYNSFRTIMEQDPKNLEESQIVDAVGYGLTVDQGIDLIDRHRKLSRKDSPLMASEAKRGVKRITNAFEAGIIKHPDFIEDAIPRSEDEYKNSLLRDRMIDEFEEWLKEKPRTPDEIRIHTNEALAPYEAMAGESFISRIMGNFSYQATAFSNKEYREALESLNKEAQAEWAYTEKVSGVGFWKLSILPDDFIRKWQSPHKILTSQIARIYLKWAHGDLVRAKAMSTKDGWKEPK